MFPAIKLGAAHLINYHTFTQGGKNLVRWNGWIKNVHPLGCQSRVSPPRGTRCKDKPWPCCSTSARQGDSPSCIRLDSQLRREGERDRERGRGGGAREREREGGREGERGGERERERERGGEREREWWGEGLWESWGESDRRGGRERERLRAQEADGGRAERAWAVSLCEAGGECARMLPRFHAASVDRVPGCSLSLCAGRAAASTCHAFAILFDVFICDLCLCEALLACVCVCVLHMRWEQERGGLQAADTHPLARQVSGSEDCSSCIGIAPPQHPQPFTLPISLCSMMSWQLMFALEDTHSWLQTGGRRGVLTSQTVPDCCCCCLLSLSLYVSSSKNVFPPRISVACALLLSTGRPCDESLLIL